MPGTSNVKKVLLAAFIAIELCLLVWWLSGLDGQYDNEDFLFFHMLLVALGFPSTLIAAALISLLNLVVPILAGHTRMAAVAIWLVFALVAYLQWFVWVPMLVQRVRSCWQRRSET